MVSKPLSAIGKILEGMQGDEEGETPQSHSAQSTPGGEGRGRRAPEPRRRAVRRDREREETPESPSQRLSQLGISDSAPVSGT